MDGTFYLGDRLLDGSLEFIEQITALRQDYLFLTNNSSKNRSDYAKKISRLGLVIPDSKVLTSGEAAVQYLSGLQPGARLYVVGTPSLEDEFRQAGFELVEDQPDWIVLGFDTTLTYAKLWKLCNLARSGVPYLATHPDINCPAPDGYMPDIGAMISFVQVSTGRAPDVVIGKPNRLIVEMAAQKLGLPLSRLTMIGDRLYTDIALGSTTGITTVLVLSGETQLADLAAAGPSAHQPDFIFSNLGELAAWLKEHS